MQILSWLFQGRKTESTQQIYDAHRVDEATDHITRLNPRLKLVRHYHERLGPAVAVSLMYVDELVASLPSSREVNESAWSSDPYIHAFFAAPSDIARSLSRSAALRTLFEENSELTEAYAVLSMAINERNILGVALEGENMRRDVIQTTLNFSDHQVRICGCSEVELRYEIVRRVIDQLGLEGLARVAADKSRRDLLERERNLLKTRLQLLERRGIGMRSVLGAETEEEAEELLRLQEQIDENEQNLNGLGIQSEALERELDRLNEVLAKPQEQIYVEDKRFHLNKMNIVVPENSDKVADDITIQVARIPTDPPQMRAVALVRFARRELLPPTNMFNEAAWLLH